MYIYKSNNLAVGKRQLIGGMHLHSWQLSSGISLFLVNVEMLQQPVSHDSLSSFCLCLCAVPPTIAKGDISGTGLSPKEVKIKVNHSLTLECEAHAIPAAAISWYKDGQASHKLIPSSEGMWDRKSCVFPVPGNSIHAGQQESPALPAAGGSSAQQFGVFAVTQTSENRHAGFWWVPGSA